MREKKGWACSRVVLPDDDSTHGLAIRRELMKRRGVVWYFKTEEQAEEECARLNRAAERTRS
jgi:hypothetical protein